MPTMSLVPVSTEDYRRIAEKILPRFLFDYVDGGAFAEMTLARNVADFQKIVPRQKVMVDVSQISTATELAATSGTEADAAETSAAPADAKMLGELVNIIADSMNALFDGSAISASPDFETESFQNEVRNAVTSWFDSEGSQFNASLGSGSDSEASEFKTDFGIGFDFEDTDGKVFKFSQNDRTRFEDALASPQSSAAVQQALFGIESGGLFNQLHSALTAAGTGSEFKADPIGLFLDVSI